MMIHQPLLTVIVPCYNVEKYIDKCVLSVVSQTYSNLEILLINDGSSDETEIICNSWQEKDHRIKVIHKQNEGSSYARKTGVENATAEYVTFVDADDWIDKNMYANMMNALLSTHSDIVQCGVCDAFEDGKIQHRSSEYQDGSFEIIDRINGVLLIIEGKTWLSYMWNKIFKKHLFDYIEFPKGRGLHEDLSIIHILFHHASQTVYLRDEYYFYLHRSGSITNSAHILKSKIKNLYDSCAAHYERYCFVQQYPEYHSMLKPIREKATMLGIFSLWDMIDYPQYFPDDAYDKQSERLKQFSLFVRDSGIYYYLNLDLWILKKIQRCYKIFYRIFFRKFFHKCINISYKRLIMLHAK